MWTRDFIVISCLITVAWISESSVQQDDTCVRKDVVPTGGPCPNGNVKWSAPRPNMCVIGNDITAKAGLSMEACRDFCLTFPGCTGVDLLTGGLCYLNFKSEPVQTCWGFTYSGVECCSSNSAPECKVLDSKAGGSGPCHSGRAKFLDYQPTKFVPGYDIKAELGHTVASCRQLCWDTAGCQSADITNAGVCYLNSVKTPVANSPLFSLIDFECCEGAEPPCQYKTPAPTGGPCSNGYVKWSHPKPNSCVVGHDIAAKGGMTLETCRDFCLNYPGCTGVDLTTGGVCYANFKNEPVQTCHGFSYSGLECCSKESNSACTSMPITPTGSPCSSGSIQWADPKPTAYVPGMDLASKAGMTVKTCQEFCWTYPGCVSADITSDGVCYLNYAKTPVAYSYIFSLLDFECCKSGAAPTCQSRALNAGDSGPCRSGIAKFLDYQPGKYIIGMDIKVAVQQTVESCRQLCWDTPKCLSADLTNTGVCYLNNVKGPVATSPFFSFIDFECCQPEIPPTTTTTAAPETTTLAPGVEPTTAAPPPCTKETVLEISFVLDASASIGEDNYVNGLKPAVKGIINLMIPGPADVPTRSRVACVVYSTNTVLEWPLDKYNKKEDLFKAVDAIPYYNAFTATGDGLHEVLAKIHPQARRDVKHIVILITDGEQNWGSFDGIQESQKIRDAGMALFVIGVGNEIDKATLDKMAAGPSFRADVTNYKNLVEQMEKLATMTCNEAVKS